MVLNKKYFSSFFDFLKRKNQRKFSNTAQKYEGERTFFIK